MFDEQNIDGMDFQKNIFLEQGKKWTWLWILNKIVSTVAVCYNSAITNAFSFSFYLK